MEIEAFAFDEENEEKINSHGISIRRVQQILENPYLDVPNRRNRRALRLMIGRDNGGACICVPIEPTRDPKVWRPVTAWPCKDSELQRLEREE